MKPFKYIVKGVFLMVVFYTFVALGSLGMLLYAHRKYELFRGMDR